MGYFPQITINYPEGRVKVVQLCNTQCQKYDCGLVELLETTVVELLLETKFI